MQNKSNPGGGHTECAASGGAKRWSTGRGVGRGAERVSPDVKPLAMAILSHIVVLWVIRRHWLILVFSACLPHLPLSHAPSLSPLPPPSAAAASSGAKQQ